MKKASAQTDAFFGEPPFSFNNSVWYGLTQLGKEELPIIDALADFGNYYKSVAK